MILPALLDGAPGRRIAAWQRAHPPDRVHRSVGCGLAPAGARVLSAKGGTGTHAFLMFPTAANFGGLRTREVRRIPLPRTLVNKGKKKGRIRCEWPDLPDSAHVLRLLALPTPGRLVTNRLTFLRAPVPLSLYGRVVHEDVFAAFVGADEAVAVLRVGALHGWPGHAFSPFPEPSTTKPGPTVPPPSTPVGPRSDMVA